jgi:hypothetical protein
VTAAELLNNIKQRIRDFEVRLQAKSNEFKVRHTLESESLLSIITATESKA